jgi:pimeloyl-ACP methyl ester carboxylesterase
MSEAAGSERLVDAGGTTLRAIRRGPSGGAVAVLLHGYGIPTAAAFDVPGASWMADLAERGIEAWAVDLPGFGGSDRPDDSPAATRAAAAAPAIAAFLEGVRDEAHGRSLHLVGWSFGAIVAGRVAAAAPELLDGLVLLGAMHATPYPEGAAALVADAAGAYVPMAPEAALVHWEAMLDGRADLADAAIMRAVVGVVRGIRHRVPVGGSLDLSRPTGPLLDLRAAWSGRPAFDAAAIRTPTLVVRGALDRFADPHLAACLTGAPVAEHVVADATHWVMCERARGSLFDLVSRFVVEGPY